MRVTFRVPLVCLGYLALACWTVGGLLLDPNGRVLALNPNDQALVEWFLAYGSRVWDGDHSLVSDRLNAPDGVNMLANAGMTGLGVLFAPVTMLFGAPATFAVLGVLNLAATASGWYLLMSRTLKLSQPASIIGGLFCGFAPGMVSQANSHLHMTAQWLVPPMIWCVVALWRASADPRVAARRLLVPAVSFGLLVTVQVFIGEETLFLTALTLVFWSLGYLIMVRPPWGRVWRFAASVAIAVAVAVPLLLYPLWLQFEGPQSVPNGVFNADYFYADLASFVHYSPLSIAGHEGNAWLSTGPAEYNTFLGWPLIILTLVLTVWLRRNAAVLASAVSAVIMCALSLGSMVMLSREATGIDGLYTFLKDVPVVDGALPMRFALAAIPLTALILAIGWDAAAQAGAVAASESEEKGETVSREWIRIGMPAALVIALLPLAPWPLPVGERDPVPSFYADGHWRQCADEGDVIIPVPLATPSEPGPMRYGTAARAGFGMPEGFFIGPYGPGGRATVGTYKRPTSHLLAEVAKTGAVPEITDEHRAAARIDLGRWEAACVVLTEHPNRIPLQVTLESLLGPGEYVADALVWKMP
jgi:hypothetical protein